MALPGGIETWVTGGGLLSVLAFQITGFARGWIWTSAQVDNLKATHVADVNDLTKRHSENMSQVVARYEMHLKRTVELYQGRIDDTKEREKEWHGVANTALETNREFAGQMDAVVESQRTLIGLVAAARDIAGRTNP
jgi:hypothetical protein